MSEDARERTFREIVVPEIPALYGVAVSLTRHRADAEDLVQDTLLRAFRAIERFDGAHPRAWLFTIMRNAQVNRVRRRRPVLLHDPDRDLERLDTAADERDQPEEIVVNQLSPQVLEAFFSLPTHQQQVVDLVDVQGLSYQETADRLDIPVGTVMSRLHRARNLLRRRLETERRALQRRGVSDEGWLQ